MNLTDRQIKIVDIVKEAQPISGENIAAELGLSRATIRSDLSILTMTGLLDARPKVGYFYTGLTFKPLIFDKIYKKNVDQIMVSPLIVEQSLSVYDAVTHLFMYDVGSLYVKNEENELTGVFSKFVLLMAKRNKSLRDKIPVAMIMTRMPNIVTVTPDQTILEAGTLLTRHQVDSLPVVDAENPLKVVGKITKTLIMNYFIHIGNEMEHEDK